MLIPSTVMPWGCGEDVVWEPSAICSRADEKPVVPMGVNRAGSMGTVSSVIDPTAPAGAITVRKWRTNCEPPTVENVYDSRY